MAERTHLKQLQQYHCPHRQVRCSCDRGLRIVGPHWWWIELVRRGWGWLVHWVGFLWGLFVSLMLFLEIKQH